MFLEICTQIHSVVFAFRRQTTVTSKKYAKTINLLCAGNKVFAKYQAQGWGFNPKTPPLRTPLPSLACLTYRHKVDLSNPCFLHVFLMKKLCTTTSFTAALTPLWVAQPQAVFLFLKLALSLRVYKKIWGIVSPRHNSLKQLPSRFAVVTTHVS